MREGFLARYEGDAQLLVHLQSLEVCTTALPFHSLEESKYLIPDWRTIDMSQAILLFETDDIDESLPRGSATMYDTSMNTAMSV